MNDNSHNLPTPGYQSALQSFVDSALSQSGSVYYENQLAGRRRALATTFSACAQLIDQRLGASHFAQLAHTYAIHYPADHWDINRYGDRFAQLLGAQSHSAKAGLLPWQAVAAMASIEYQLNELYYHSDTGDDVTLEIPQAIDITEAIDIAEAPDNCPTGVTARLQAHHPYAIIETRASSPGCTHSDTRPQQTTCIARLRPIKAADSDLKQKLNTATKVCTL